MKSDILISNNIIKHRDETDKWAIRFKPQQKVDRWKMGIRKSNLKGGKKGGNQSREGGEREKIEYLL